MVKCKDVRVQDKNAVLLSNYSIFLSTSAVVIGIARSFLHVIVSTKWSE